MKRERGALAASPPDLRESLFSAWRASARATAFLVERWPEALWEAPAPGLPRRSIRMIASHLHNARCSWVRTLGRPCGVAVPDRVDRLRVGRKELLTALDRSAPGIESLLRLACEHGGRIPPPPNYVWRNLPLDAGHVLAYFSAHEGHHRGQLVMLARQLGHRLPDSVTGGIWAWTRFGRERRKA